MPHPYRKLSNLDRARALGQLQARQSSRRVAMAFNTSRQSIDRIRQRYAASGDVKDLPRSGRPRATNRAEDRLITNTTLRNRFTNVPTTTRRIRQQRGAGGIPVSVQTIRNRLRATGLKSRVPAKKPCLSQGHRAARLQFARYHVRWNRQQWRTVTFSDERRFCLRHIDRRLRVWRRNGERHAEVNVQPCHAYNGGSVMVWAGVTADRRTDLVVVPGILTGQRYIDEILRPHVVPFLRQMGNNGIFQDDKARPHRARIVDGFLQANNVRRLEWPAMSPDLSCIEHVWDVLGRAVQKRMTEHSTMADLRRFLGEEWQRIPQATTWKLVFSTRKRLIECRDNRGGYTHY